MSRPRSEKAPERSNFAQTCNLLSQFVQRRGSLRDLNLEIGGKIESLEAIVKSRSRHHAPPPALNSPVNKEKSVQPGTEQRPSNEPSFDINVQLASNTPRNFCNPMSNNFSKATAAAKRKIAQLTMFYGGKVLIFDDYPEDRAKELVALAKKGSSQMSYGIYSSNPSPGKMGTGERAGLPPRPQATGAHRHVDMGRDVAPSSQGKERGPPLNEAIGSDMPIARRTSLHRFLEKRKDRAGGRGPYQIQEEPVAASSSKDDEQLKLKL